MEKHIPAYLKLLETDELAKRAEILQEKLKSCVVCPHHCKVDRLENERQVGDLKTDSGGLAYKGLLVRHLVMPDNLADTDKVMEFISQEISKDTVLNIMSQYYPAHKSFTFPELSRRITSKEYADAVLKAKELGLKKVIIA
ncbi:MAG: hypothetical protein N3B21_15960 [Clostridia bacterium]|nr:hypothetical protein [Clostridia bacterium]